MLISAVIACVCAGPGCGPLASKTTIRLIDGKPEETRYVSPAAYEHYMRAQIAVSRGAFKKAAKEIRIAIAHDHQSPFLLTELARILIQAGRHRDADQQLKMALDLRPGYPDALLLRGNLANNEGHRKGAEATYRLCIRHNRSYAPCHLALAGLLEQTDRPDAARRILKQLIARNRSSTAGHQRLALLCLRQFDYKCAAHHYGQVLQTDTDLRVLLQLAHVHRSLGQMHATIRLLRETFDRSGGDHQVASVLLQVLHQQGMDQAVDDLLGILESAAHDDLPQVHELASLCLEVDRPQRALALLNAKQEDGSSLVLSAEALNKLDRTDEAIALLRAKMNPENGAKATRLLAVLLGRQKAHHQASEVLRRGIETYGPSTELVQGLSLSLHLEGKIEASIQVVRTALGDRPDSRDLHFILAMALHRAGRWRQAVRVMKQVVAKEPQYAPGHNFIGYTLVEQNRDLDLAERSIRKALFLQPGEGYIIDSLGWLHYRRGNMARAKQLLEMAVRLEPREPEILAHLAEIRIALKQPEQAIGLIKRAITVSEDQVLTTRLQARLRELEQGRVGTR